MKMSLSLLSAILSLSSRRREPLLDLAVAMIVKSQLEPWNLLTPYLLEILHGHGITEL